MKVIADFNVLITSVNNNTWQREVKTEDDSFFFKSEMQLFKWLCKKYPSLLPENKLYNVTDEEG